MAVLLAILSANVAAIGILTANYGIPLKILPSFGHELAH